MSMDKEPGEERLVTDWTLTLADTFEVEKCRGESNRRWVAFQLRFLRNEGGFLKDFTDFLLKVTPVRDKSKARIKSFLNCKFGFLAKFRLEFTTKVAGFTKNC